MDTSGKAFVDFWKWVADKGLMKHNSARNLRTAAVQVLSVLDNWEELDVTALNTDDVQRRFVNKRHNEFAPDSLATYKRRFNQALSEFLAYTKSPETWKPSGEVRVTKRKEKAVPATPPPVDATPSKVETLPGRAGLVEYPFPLREGRFAFLRLPMDLNGADVKRLVGFLNTLVEDAAGA